MSDRNEPPVQSAHDASSFDFRAAMGDIAIDARFPDETVQAQPAGLELVELELAIDSLQSEHRGFSDTVDAAVRSLDGELLFCLPASGLAEGQQKIAVVRLPLGGTQTLAFVFLSADGTRMSVRAPDDQTSPLASFSRAFVDLLERF